MNAHHTKSKFGGRSKCGKKIKNSVKNIFFFKIEKNWLDNMWEYVGQNVDFFKIEKFGGRPKYGKKKPD